MGLVLFYYTLLLSLVALMASAVCLSAYLVSHKHIMKLACVGFLLYFVDMIVIFQDEFLSRAAGIDLDPNYFIVRSIISLAAGIGFLVAAWCAIYEFMGVSHPRLIAVSSVVFVLVSMLVLFGMPVDEEQRFWFWTARQGFALWILIAAGAEYVRCREEVERARMRRYVGIYALAIILVIGVTVEDAAFFLVLDAPSIHIGNLWFSTERNYVENLLFLIVAIGAFRSSWRILSLRFERPPAQGGSAQQEQQIVENLNVYAKRNELTAREREVLYLVLLGKDNQNIASEMQLALSTVKVHVHNILQKTECSNRQDLLQDFWKTS